MNIEQMQVFAGINRLRKMFFGDGNQRIEKVVSKRKRYEEG